MTDVRPKWDETTDEDAVRIWQRASTYRDVLLSFADVPTPEFYTRVKSWAGYMRKRGVELQKFVRGPAVDYDRLRRLAEEG